jgi:hypothetical protein
VNLIPTETQKALVRELREYGVSIYLPDLECEDASQMLQSNFCALCGKPLEDQKAIRVTERSTMGGRFHFICADRQKCSKAMGKGLHEKRWAEHVTLLEGDVG